MSITIQGFNQEQKPKKEKISDLISFIGSEEARPEFQKLDITEKYTGACDGVRAALAGNIENFFYETFDPEENFTLNLLTKVLINPKTLDYEYNKITVNIDELLEATKLFAKNINGVRIDAYHDKKKGKLIEKKVKYKRPLVLRFPDNRLTMNFPGTEMFASLDSYNEISGDIEKIGMNAQYLLDGLKLFKNRKHQGSITIYFTKGSPLCMYSENLYIMILPVSMPKDEQ